MPHANRFRTCKALCILAALTLLASLRAGQPVQGTVQAFGDNLSGQLGNGFEYRSPQLGLATGLSKIAGGGNHTIALKTDGTVLAWGLNSSGELGDGTTTITDSIVPVPVPVVNLTNVTAIAAGFAFSVALKDDGTVWTWGASFDGQLGNGSLTESSVPVQVSNLSGVTAISAGAYHCIALKNDGTVVAWGDNSYGQAGDGTKIDRPIPVTVINLTGAAAISAGFAHNYALKNDGSVVAWGFNGDGEFGNGDTTSSTTPVPISGLSNVAAITAGGFHGFAKKLDGTVWTWGKNLNGQLGLGDFTNRLTPVQNTALTGVTALAGDFDHSLALQPDGTLLAWGENGVGQLGTGTRDTSNVPVTVGLSGVASFATGQFFSLAVKGDGTVFAWGFNATGQFGNGSLTGGAQAVEVLNLTGVTAIASGAAHNLALKNDGTVVAWGSNSNGQLGNGNTTDSNIPVPVNTLTEVVAVACAGNHSLALKSNGTVWAWGANATYQLGNGTIVDSPVPIAVSGLSGVSAISAGANFFNAFSLALKSDGTVWVWGAVDGDAKRSFTIGGKTPEQLAGLAGITAIASGGSHLLALRSDKTVWALGKNNFGQLGNGKTSKLSAKPVQVNGLTNAAGIAAGQNHSLARTQDGSVMAWGINSSGELGTSKLKDSKLPVRVLLLNNVVSIAAGTRHNLAVKSDGSVFSWGGYSFQGELGRIVTAGTFASGGLAASIPAQVASISGAVSVSAGDMHSLVLLNSASPAVTSLAPQSVQEQFPIGTQVGTFTTFDASGLEKTFTYSFVTGEGSDDNASFSLSTNKLLTAAVFEFATKATYSIRISTMDNLGASVEEVFIITVLAAPNSGTDGTANVSIMNGDDGFVVNPINDLVITMQSSNGGVIQLKIDVTPAGNELEASTDFEDIPGRSAIVIGFNPVHKFVQKGIYVATVTVVEKISRIKVATGRKMINIDESETQMPGALRGNPRLLGRPVSTRIPTKGLKGSFFFSGSKTDSVKYVGTFALPAGFNPAQPNEFSFGIGNVIVDALVNENGNIAPIQNSQHAANNSFFKNLSIKFSRIRKGQIANGGEIATFSATVLTSALPLKGFDTEGITNAAARDIAPGASAPRFIQISYNLGGVAYEDRADVIFVLSPASDFGTISGRR